jgi:putative ABC transport system permease protein
MTFFMILKVALRAIFRNKTRSLLTALGIIVGIAALIAAVASGQGAQAMMVREISSIGNNIIMVFPGSRGALHGWRSDRCIGWHLRFLSRPPRLPSQSH